MREEERYTAQLFFKAVIPLIKDVALGTSLQKSFEGKSGIIQISADLDGEKEATHFILDKGEWTVRTGESEHKPDVELYFPNARKFNAFFKGTSKALPKIKGITHLGLLIPTFKTLLKMAALLSAKEAPEDEATKILVTKLFLYLLSVGISTLNKMGHPDVHGWALKSPDRVYGWSVDGYDDVAAHLRVKAGKTRARRGVYTRSKPFFNMRFADIDSALAILLQTGDMLALTAEKKLIMEGAPEFGAKIGDYMMLVGSYVQ